MINKVTGAINVLEAPLSAGQQLEDFEVDPLGHYLVVSATHDSSINSYQIDSSSGQLTFKSTFSTGLSAPRFMAIHPNRKFIYVTDSNSGLFSVQIDPSSGALSALGAPQLNDSYWGLVMNPSGTLLYGTALSSGIIYGFTVDQTTGALTSVNGGAGFSYPFLIGPNMYVDPALNYIFLPQYLSTSVAAFAVNPATGVLTAAPGSPFTVSATNSGTVIDSTGKFIYFSDNTANKFTATKFTLTLQLPLYHPPPTWGVGGSQFLPTERS